MLVERETRFKILIFCICSFIMIFIGVVCAFSLKNLIDDSKKLPENLKKNVGILLIFEDKNEKSIDFLCGVNIDAGQKNIRLFPVSKDERTVYNGEEASLCEIFSENGAQALFESIQNSADTPFEKYVCLDKSAIEKIANITGDITADINEGAKFSKDGADFSFESGENVLSPEKFSALFMHFCKLNKTGSALKMLEGAFAKLSKIKLYKWQEKEFFNVIKDTKSNIASYDFDDLAKIFLNMDNAQVEIKQ